MDEIFVDFSKEIEQKYCEKLIPLLWKMEFTALWHSPDSTDFLSYSMSKPTRNNLAKLSMNGEVFIILLSRQDINLQYINWHTFVIPLSHVC